jgi:hypothetical protein
MLTHMNQAINKPRNFTSFIALPYQRGSCETICSGTQVPLSSAEPAGSLRLRQV